MLERVPAQVLFTRGDETASRLRALVAEAEWVCVAVGYARMTGLAVIGPRFTELAAQRRAFLLSGERPGQLTSELVSHFRKEAPDALRVVPSQEVGGMMHAKVWLIQPQNPSVLWAFIGSANLSRTALTANDEVGIWAVLPSTAADATKLTDWFRSRWDAGYLPEPEQFASERASLDGDAVAVPERMDEIGAAAFPQPLSELMAPASTATESSFSAASVERAVFPRDHAADAPLISAPAPVAQVAQQAQLRAEPSTSTSSVGVGRSTIAPPIAPPPRVDVDVDEADLREWAAEPPAPGPVPAGGHDPLHPFQSEAIASIDALFDSLQRVGEPFTGVLSLPTGSGKTKVAAWWALSRFVKQGKQVLWIAHRAELLNQAYKTVGSQNLSPLTERVSQNLSPLG